ARPAWQRHRARSCAQEHCGDRHAPRACRHRTGGDPGEECRARRQRGGAHDGSLAYAGLFCSERKSDGIYRPAVLGRTRDGGHGNRDRLARKREEARMDLAKYGPWALIIGASEGVGAAFARKLAADGFKLVLVARKPEPLEELAAELRADGAEVRALSADLSQSGVLDKVRSVTDDITIGLLVYNAGANSVRGNFVELPEEVTQAVISVNVLGQVN